MALLYSPRQLKSLHRDFKLPRGVSKLMERNKLFFDAPVVLARNQSITPIDSARLSFLPEEFLQEQSVLLKALESNGSGELCPDLVADGTPLCLKDGVSFETDELCSRYKTWNHLVFSLNTELSAYNLRLYETSQAEWSSENPGELISLARFILAHDVSEDEYILCAGIHTNTPLVRPWEVIAFKNWLFQRHSLYFVGGKVRTMLLCGLPGALVDIEKLNSDASLLRQSSSPQIDQELDMQTVFFNWVDRPRRLEYPWSDSSVFN